MRKKCSARSRRSARATPMLLSGSSMFLSTFSQGKSAASWKTMPRSAPAPEMIRSATRTTPALGASRPATTLSSVDLPHPDGPDQADELAFGDFERDVAQRGSRPPAVAGGKRLREASDFEERGHRAFRCGTSAPWRWQLPRAAALRPRRRSWCDRRSRRPRRGRAARAGRSRSDLRSRTARRASG